MKGEITKLTVLILVLAVGCSTGVGNADPVAGPALVNTPLVDLNVTGLSPGIVTSWTNKGTLDGSFRSGCSGSLTVETVAGRKAVTFSGNKRLKSTFTAPAGITGNSNFTVAVWAYNPSIADQETIVAWSQRGGPEGTDAELVYGTNTSYGVVCHWMWADMGFDGGIPPARQWHHIAVTFDGSTEKVYVDGILNAQEEKTLQIYAGNPIYLGCADDDRYFSGSLAAVNIYDYTLSEEEVNYLAGKHGTKPKPAIVDLDAKELPAGALTTWPNKGTLGGSFSASSSGPVVEMVAGRKAMTFDGTQWLESTFTTPAGITGNSDFTVAVWAYNPSIPDQETMVAWSQRGGPEGTNVELIYGNSPSYGAVGHWGWFADMGFDGGVPAAGKWHHIVVTFDGRVEKIYVDGILNAKKDKMLNIYAGKSIYIGCADKDRYFSGSLASVRIYDHALSAEEVAQLYNPDPALQKLIDKVREAEVRGKRLKPKEAVTFLENIIAPYEQSGHKNFGAMGSVYKQMFSELYYLLAEAKKAAGDLPKEDIAVAYKRVIELDLLSPIRKGAGLLWLYENVTTEGYKDFTQSLLQNNSNYLEGVVATAEMLIHEQKSKAAIEFLVDNLAVYAEYRKKNPGSAANFDRTAGELHFQLAKAKYASGSAGKEEVANACKRVVESGELSLEKLGSALLWACENISTEYYENIVHSLFENNSDNLVHYLNGVGAKAKLMVEEQKLKAAMKFLETNLAEYLRWRKETTVSREDLDGRAALLYLQLAETKAATGASKNDIAEVCCKAFNLSPTAVIPTRSNALIWLLENDRTGEYTELIRSFTHNEDVKEPFTNLIDSICKNFESKGNWTKFKLFLDTLFTEAMCPHNWMIFVESCLNDKTNQWANEYFKYLQARPSYKFHEGCIVAERYMVKEDFKKAIESYKDIVSRCGAEDDKALFQLKICECLFKGGEYSKAASQLDSFIANNRTTHRNLAKYAMLTKGRCYAQLGELDKAIDSFHTLVKEYPGTMEAAQSSYFIGYCYMLQGKFNAAKEAFDCIIKDHPSSPYTNRARRYMTRIESMTEQ